MRKIIIVLATCIMLAGCARMKNFDSFDLRYTPTNVTNVPFPAEINHALNIPLTIVNLKDSRIIEKNVVGENREDAKTISIKVTNNVAGFATTVLKQQFIEWGGTLSDNANYQLSGEIVKLFVTETNLYAGEVLIKFYLKDHKGKMKWSGIKNGAARRFGRSLSDENYNEVISDALRETYSRLFSDVSFVTAWAGKK